MTDSTFVNWGMVAALLAGIGSLLAGVTAIYFSYARERIALRGACGLRSVVDDRGTAEPVFAVHATNVSARRTVVTEISIGFVLVGWTRYGLVPVIRTPVSHGIPKALAAGESGSWTIPLGADNAWLKELIGQFGISKASVHAMRVYLHTSNGGTTILRPEKSFRELLLSEIEERERERVRAPSLR